MLLMSDVYKYVPIEISNVSGDITLFKVLEALKTDSVVFRKICILDAVDTDWFQIKMLEK